jgi:hypothetical protein
VTLLVRGVLGGRGIASFALGALCFCGALPRSGSLRFIPAACAQTEAELTAARQLFADALTDERAGRHAAALEKFQRVQAVRDTQSVRYRIATCLEALGQLRAALAAYTSTSIAAATDAESTSIARASRDKVDALSRRVARIVVTLPSHAPLDAAVKIDGEAIQPNAIGTPIVVDPGTHEITATASGSPPFKAQMNLPEGGQSAIEATLAASLPPAPVPTLAPASVTAPLPPPSPGPAPLPASPPSEPTSSHGRATAGLVFVSVGGVLVAAATAILLVRHSDIQSLESACASGVCPANQESQLTATHNRAVIEGPVGFTAGGLGILGLGVGVYLLATAPSSAAHASATFAPWIDRNGGGVGWSGRF